MAKLRPPVPWGLMLGVAVAAAFMASIVSGLTLLGLKSNCNDFFRCFGGDCKPCAPLTTAAYVHVGGQAVLGAGAVFTDWWLQIRRGSWLTGSLAFVLAIGAAVAYVSWSRWWLDSHTWGA